MIETSDPGTGYPTSYEDVRGIARDPEWQCRVAEMRKSAFNEMPVHCKKAALAGKGFNVPMALAESDPIRVAKMSSKLIDSPLPKFHNPDGGYSPSNLALAFSAKATDKSSTEEKEGGCDWDKDGTDDCAATITDPGPDPLDGISAEFDFSTFDDNLADRLEAAIDLVAKYVFFASFKGGGKFEEEANRNAIKRALVWMLANPDCEKAFIDAKLATPASVIKKRGLTLASGDLILDASAAKGIGLSEKARLEFVKHVNDGAVQAFTSTTAGPRLYTVYKNTAFYGESYMWGYYPLEEIVVHEDGLHLVGVPGNYPSTIGGHDLSGHPNYKTIMSACRIDQ